VGDILGSELTFTFLGGEKNAGEVQITIVKLIFDLLHDPFRGLLLDELLQWIFSGEKKVKVSSRNHRFKIFPLEFLTRAFLKILFLGEY
jgi:hypothetical protein